uniref:Secreted protein n=1 Tax=Steinernema glaseri TaxID=37863 RepID=A0A1I7Y6D8_9BILA
MSVISCFIIFSAIFICSGLMSMWILKNVLFGRHSPDVWFLKTRIIYELWCLRDNSQLRRFFSLASPQLRRKRIGQTEICSSGNVLEGQMQHAGMHVLLQAINALFPKQ